MKISSSNSGSRYGQQFSKAASIIASAILVGAFLLPSMMPTPIADAYILDNCKWSGTDPTITYSFAGTNWTSAYKTDVRSAAILWNDDGAKFRLKEVTGTANIKLVYSTSSGTLKGLTTLFCLNGVASSATIKLYSQTIGTQRQVTQWTAAHEFGHALGLDHPSETNTSIPTLMNKGYNGYVGPILDERRAVTQTNGEFPMYGQRPSTLACSPSFQGGTVTYGSSCGGSGLGYPITMKVTTLGVGNAATFTSSSGSTLPGQSSNDNRVLMLTAKVKATTLGKFSMGVYTNTIISDTANRVMSVELNSNGVFLVYSSSGGVQTVTPISSTALQTGTVYWVQLIIKSGQPSYAFVYKDNGNGEDNIQPTPIAYGTAPSVQGTVQKSWSSTVYYGMGVWKPTSSSPQSEYVVSEFNNLLKTYN